jgi:methyltransferase (TIGR00027 family)
VSADVRQYVVLGAGLDTFAYRNPYRSVGLRVFEVDHPSTQGWKRDCLTLTGIELPNELTFAPVDFEHDTLAEGLESAGFDLAAPACFSWLGVTVYLTEAAVFDTLRFVAGLAEGSSVVFDYRVPQEQLNPVERIINEQIMERIAAMGEPWIAAFDPRQLQRKMLEIGFVRAEGLGPEELNRRYFYRRKDGLTTRTRIMCAWR